MPTKLDELFFEVTVKKGPGADAAIGTFTAQMKSNAAATESAAKAADDYSSSTSKAADSSAKMTGAVKKMIVALGGILILRKVTGAMLDFEDSMAEISSIAGGGAEQVEELEGSIISLSRSIPQSASELGAGAYQVLSAGISETNDVLSVLEASAKAAVAGLSSTEVAVDAITTVINAFGLDAQEATRVADILFKTVELGKLKFSDLASNIGQAATSAALAGVSVEELTSGIAVLTQRGIFTAEAVTSLNQLFLSLTKQTDEQAAAFQRLGIDFSTAAVAERGFAAVLEEVNEATGGNVDALAELFPNIRAARAAFVLAGNSLDAYKDTLAATRDSQGASERAFQKLNQTARNQARILRNNVLAVFLEIGQGALPGVGAAFSFISNQINAFVGGIKLLAVDLRVAIGGIPSFFLAATTKVTTAISALYDGFANFVAGTQNLLVRAGEAGIPGISAIATASAEGLQGLVDKSRELADATLVNTALAQNRLDASRQELEFLKQGADAMREQILLESGLVRGRQQRAELAQIEAQLAEQQRIVSEQTAEAQANAREELARRVADATLSAAEAEIVAIEKLRAAYIEAFGSIGDKAEEMFQLIEAKAQEALAKEQAEKIADDFRDALEEGLREIDIEFLDAGEEEREVILERQLQLYRDIRKEVEAQLAATEEGSDAEKALEKVLVEINDELKGAVEQQERLNKVARKGADERFKDLQLTISLLKQAADGAINLANSFGLINDETAETLNNLADIAQGAATAGAGIASGNPAAIIGGGLQLLGGIGGLFGGDPEEKRIREANTEAIKELTRQMGEFGQFDITGRLFANVERRLSDLAQARTVTEWRAAVKDLERQLEAGVITTEELQQAADALGIEFKERLNPSMGELRKLAEAIAATEITRFAETYTGQLEALRHEFEIFDINDPIEQLQRLAEVMSNPRFGAPALRDALAGLDLSTPEGRRQAQENIERLFRALQAGTLTPSQLGGLTGSEFLQALNQIESTLDQVSTTSTGATQDIRQNIQITELQANQLLAFQSTLVFRAEERNQLLLAILHTLGGTALAVPAVPIDGGPGNGAGTGGRGTITIQIGPNEFNLTGSTQTDAMNIVDEISRKLGERLEDQQALFGESI